MKIIQIVFLILAFSITCYSQSYISSTDINIIQSSTKITYINGSVYVGSLNYNSTGNALATLQARYDAAHNLINGSWGKVKYTELINTSNKTILKNWDNQVTNFLKNGWPNGFDFGRSPSKAQEVSNWVLSIFNNEYIKDELTLLKEVDREIRRLKRDHPGVWHKTERYKEIATAINLLRSCELKEIQNLSAKYGLF